MALIPTLSGATAINITSGGFQPRVTAIFVVTSFPRAEFSALAVVTNGHLWVAIGYFPEAVSDSGTLDLAELHAAALSF